MEHLDAHLYTTLNTLPAFPFTRMVRPDRKGMRAMRDAFFAHRTLPIFSYTLASTFDTQRYLRALDIVADRVETFPVAEIVRSLYREKIEELRTRCMLIQAIQRKDDETVTSLADHLYGMPELTETELKTEFEGILSRASTLHTHTQIVSTPRC